MSFGQPPQQSVQQRLRERLRGQLVDQVLRDRFGAEPTVPIAPPPPLEEEGDEGGGGFGGFLRTIFPQPLRDAAGAGLAGVGLRGGEALVDLIGYQVQGLDPRRIFDGEPPETFVEYRADEDRLGRQVFGGIESVPAAGRPAGFVAENFLPFGGIARGAALGGTQLGLRLAREAAIGVGAAAGATGAGYGIRALDEAGVPIPGVVGAGVAIGAGFAAGGGAARAIPIRGAQKPPPAPVRVTADEPGVNAEFVLDDILEGASDNSLVPDLRSYDEVAAELRHIPADFGPGPLQRAVEWGAGLIDQRSIARDPFGRDISVYGQQIVSGENLAVQITRSIFAQAPRQGVRGTAAVFDDVDADGIVQRWGKGWGDVIEDYRDGRIRLEGQERQVADAYLESLRQMNVKLYDAGLIDDVRATTRAGVWVPRQNLGKPDLEFTRPSRSRFDREYTAERGGMTRAIRDGYKYEDMETTHTLYMRSGYQQLAIQQLSDSVALRSVKPRVIAEAVAKARAARPGGQRDPFVALEQATRRKKDLQSRLGRATRQLRNRQARRSEVRRREPTARERGEIRRGEGERLTARRDPRGRSLDSRAKNLDREVEGLRHEEARIRKELRTVNSEIRGLRTEASRRVKAAEHADHAPGFLFGRADVESIPKVRFLNSFIEKPESWDVLRKRIDPLTGRFHEQPHAIASGVQDVISVTRTLSAAFDISAPFVQMLPMFARDPARWARVVGNGLRAIVQPGYADEYFASKENTLQFLARQGSPTGSGSVEAVSATAGARNRAVAIFQRQRGEGPKTVLGIVGERLLSAPVLRRLQQSYDDMVLMGRIETVEALRPHWRGSDTLLARHADHMFGTLDTRNLLIGANQRQVEGAFLAFSSRMLRSTTALVGDAMRPWTPQGEEALVTMLRMAGVASLFYYATALTQGMTPEEVQEGLNPLNGRKFLAIQSGEEWIGVGGQVRAIMQFAAKAMSEPSTMLSADSYENPLIRFYMSRAAVGTGLVLGGVEGISGGRADALPFKDFDNPGDWFAHMGKSTLPFVLQNVLLDEQGGWAPGVTTGNVVEYFGLRGSPASYGDIRNALAYEKHDRTWDELTPGERQTIEEDNPRLAEMQRASASRDLRAYQDDVETINNERLHAEQAAYAALGQGVSRQDVAEHIEFANREAIIRRQQAWKSRGLDRGRETDDDNVLSRWYGTIDEAAIGGQGGPIDWELVDMLRADVYANATPEEKRVLDDLRRTPHAQEVAGYYAAKDIINSSGYYEVGNQLFDKLIGDREILPGHEIRSYAQLVAALNRANEAGNFQAAVVLEAYVSRLDGLIGQARQVLRARSPELESALLATGRIQTPLNPTVRPFWP